MFHCCISHENVEKTLRITFSPHRVENRMVEDLSVLEYEHEHGPEHND